MWTGPAPMRPYNKLVHPRSWRAFMEYGNGIIGDMFIHMLVMVRWMMDFGWPKRVSSSGGILVDKKSKANISDTQSAVFDFGDFDVVWTHRTWGEAPDPKYPWAAIFYGDKGTLKASVMSYDFTLSGGGQNIHRDVTYELEQYSRRQNRKGSGKTRSACHPRTHEGFSRRHFQPQQTRCRYRTRLYFDDHLYPGQSLDAAWPDSGLGSGERAGDWRCGSKSLTATAIPRSLGAS